MEPIISHALAKVNLALNITGKIKEYHKMQSIFAFLIDLYDELKFFPNREFSTDSAEIPGIKNNSVKKAWEILKNNFSFKVPHVEIKKRIPICGGLGGGSSDAACFVNSVFDFWGFSENEKMKHIEIFRPLGSDAKVFLFKYFTNCRFVYINGTGLDGEIFSINPQFKDECILIINNETQLSTKEVFLNFKDQLCPENPKSMLKFHNSLQNSALELNPSLKQILNELSQTSPKFFGVSGSGASCFGVYENRTAAEIARASIHYAFQEISSF